MDARAERRRRARLNRRTFWDVLILIALVAVTIVLGHVTRGYWAVGPEVLLIPVGALVIYERRQAWK